MNATNLSRLNGAEDASEWMKTFLTFSPGVIYIWKTFRQQELFFFFFVCMARVWCQHGFRVPARRTFAELSRYKLSFEKLPSKATFYAFFSPISSFEIENNFSKAKKTTTKILKRRYRSQKR